MKFDITYGTTHLSFVADDRFLTKDQPFIKPRKPSGEPSNTPEEKIRLALKNPVNSPRIRDMIQGKKTCLVISDEFRAGQHEMILKCTLAEIALGKPASLKILCATGSHDATVYSSNISKWAKKYTDESKIDFEFYANDCDAPDFASAGTTSRDTPVEVNRHYLESEVRIYVHESKHHYMNGYSCIDKHLLPGLSSRKSIEANHKLALQSDYSIAGRNFWVADPMRRYNPFSIDSSEARRIAEMSLLEDGIVKKRIVPTFALDMLSDAKDVYWVQAGNSQIISTHMTAKADELFAFFADPVKYVIISPGGPPASQAIYGTQNCFDMALSGAITNDGEALVVAPCEGRKELSCETRGLAPDDKSKALFWDNLCNLCKCDLEEAGKWIGNNFELYLWKTDRVLKMMKKRNIKLHLYSTLPDDVIQSGGFIPCHDIDAWIAKRFSRKDGKLRIIDEGNKLLVMGQA